MPLDFALHDGLCNFAARMKKIDLLKLNRSLLNVMAINDIKTTDVSFIEVYDDFIELRKTMKFSSSITELSIKYNKSERTISRMLSRLQEEATL